MINGMDCIGPGLGFMYNIAFRIVKASPRDSSNGVQISSRPSDRSNPV